MRLRKPRGAEVVLPIGDTHVGGKLGLLHPDTAHYKQNEWQRYTWACWEHMLSVLPTKLDVVVFMDEMMDGPMRPGNKYGALITEPREQRLAAEKVLLPLAERAKERWFIIGSAWHVGDWGQETLNLAEALEAKVWRNENSAGYNLFLRRDRVILDFAHHRSVVMVNRSMPLERELRYRLMDNPLPEEVRGSEDFWCIVRAHAHNFGVWEDRHGIAIGTACWQGMYYDYGAAKVSVARFWKDIGWILLFVDPKASRPVTYERELYDYPKAEVWDMEEKRWISQYPTSA